MAYIRTGRIPARIGRAALVPSGLACAAVARRVRLAAVPAPLQIPAPLQTTPKLQPSPPEGLPAAVITGHQTPTLPEATSPECV